MYRPDDFGSVYLSQYDWPVIGWSQQLCNSQLVNETDVMTDLT